MQTLTIMNKFTFILCLVLLIAIKSKAQQRYAIIHRKLKIPLQLADTITKEQLDKGFFAVEKNSMDSLVTKLEAIRKRLNTVSREKYDETKWSVGNTLLTIKVVKWTYADRLNVALSTDVGNGHDRAFYIVDSRYTNADNATYIKKLIKYIEKANL